MHLKPKFINIIINILLGAAWAAVLYGFIFGIYTSQGSIFLKLINGLIDSIFGLVIVVLIEALYRFFINHELLKEQVKLLKDKSDS